MKRSAVASLLLFLGASALSFAGCELGLRYYLNSYAERVGEGSDLAWEMRFLKNPANAQDELAFAPSHPTRGWVMKPNFWVPGSPGQLTTNNRGHRASPDYVYKPDKYTVVVLGDSFTFGAEATDAEVWPTILQSMDDRMHVVNLAASGYGIDQMFITCRETIDEYKPQLVILAFTTADLPRAMIGFREAPKPRFVLSKDGSLLLTNVPIGTRVETYAQLKQKYNFLHPLLFQLGEIWRQVHAEDPAIRKRQTESLNARLLKETARCAQEHQAEILLTHLASAPQTVDPNAPDDGEQVLRRAVLGKPYPYLMTRKAFLDTHVQWTPRHYRGEEAQVVARAVLERLRALDSWKVYESRHPLPGVSPRPPPDQNGGK